MINYYSQLIHIVLIFWLTYRNLLKIIPATCNLLKIQIKVQASQSMQELIRVYHLGAGKSSDRVSAMSSGEGSGKSSNKDIDTSFGEGNVDGGDSVFDVSIQMDDGTFQALSTDTASDPVTQIQKTLI
ncbi:hypothetical protein PILCRDRAFT_85911 [Piloderma croceum F 1598]|uniref:Uncharacterized protein n=1 Tax=Piloderma croceum (strain F 1598) TaxID=765440 RepID=A0A0C3CCR9_PILCF|nr:hypothetical protein PILCRDRAFT_85911 [Piloderma croceum F 1598]